MKNIKIILHFTSATATIRGEDLSEVIEKFGAPYSVSLQVGDAPEAELLSSREAEWSAYHKKVGSSLEKITLLCLTLLFVLFGGMVSNFTSFKLWLGLFLPAALFYGYFCWIVLNSRSKG